MPKRLTAVLLATGTVALTVGLAATPSSAANATWTVRPGGSITAKGAISFKDTKTGTPIRCPSVTLTGALKSGSGQPGADIGSVTQVAITRCSVVHPTLTLTPHGLPWKLNALTYDPSLGVTSASLTGVDFTVKGDIIGPCDLILDGTAAGADDGLIKFSYTNSTGKLKLLTKGSDLHAYRVSFCDGILKNGDPMAPSGGLTLTPKQKITSP